MIPNNALREVCCLNTNTALSDYDLYTYKLVDMRKKYFLCYTELIESGERVNKKKEQSHSSTQCLETVCPLSFTGTELTYLHFA